MSLRAIANNIGKDKSTISRVQQCNTGKKGYRSKQANELSQIRVASKIKPTHLTTIQTDYIKKKIQIKWSQAQISGRMRLDG